MSAITTFRKCTRAEVDKVQELVDELYAFDQGQFPGRPKLQKTFEHLEDSSEVGEIVVFEQSKQIVGYAILIFFWSNEFGGNIVEIDELLVTKLFRRRGISRTFFSWLDSEYPDCVGFALQVSSKNADAARLYLDVGFAFSNQYLVKLRPSSQ